MKIEKGQALIETLCIFPLAISFVLLILSFAYSIYAKEISSYYLYQALLCTEEFEVKNRTCISRLEKKLHRSLFFHNDLNLTKTLGNETKKITLKARFLSFNSHYSRSIKVTGP